MRVDDRVRKPIVFVGKVGVSGNFVAHGTAFVTVSFIDEWGFQQLVTAKHVIDGIESDAVCVRLNTKDNEAQIVETRKHRWFPHPDDRVDVAICPVVLPKDQFNLLSFPLGQDLVLTDEVITERNIGIGDDVCISGMYVARLGESKNIPVVRSGTIAAMPDEEVRTQYGYHHAYLIEARSIDGLSGSPVFVQMPPWRQEGDSWKLQHGPTIYLMGVLLGHAQVENPGDTITLVQPHERPDSEIPLTRVALNTGIGVVLPYPYILEASNQPRLYDSRMKKLKEEKRRFVADSAAKVPSIEPAIDLSESDRYADVDNPDHKEDFNRLLDAAVRTPKQDDQT